MHISSVKSSIFSDGICEWWCFCRCKYLSLENACSNRKITGTRETSGLFSLQYVVVIKSYSVGCVRNLGVSLGRRPVWCFWGWPWAQGVLGATWGWCWELEGGWAPELLCCWGCLPGQTENGRKRSSGIDRVTLMVTAFESAMLPA